MPTCPATRFLAALDADWAALIAAVGPCLHQPRPEREPYQALVRAVAYQQLHARAGDAILGRLRALFPGQDFPTPGQLADASLESLRGCGFSSRKVATLQGIAQATLDGRVPDAASARGLDDEQLIERLIQLPGIGRWTVEMLLIYSLEREDILPVDDFGVREGYRRLKDLEKQPSPRQLRQIGQAWSPWRTTAAWYLWRVPTA
ncbi:DNA-3-methyladenine glycosylase II [Pseudomonas sp. NFPP10]|uniref:DNA-3-methyladenine glycosylase family protein n=1 Tax=unclassified Pseudomonas TaxID=196821 RepID=UPI000880CF73|nr:MULTISPECIES: DNA-3-methyladenine glycosylase [unclassified Pseudomonas]SDA14082.1 DNA-3-methyladenine glycosylase II [Pseudomonas sp. NFPP12]SEM51184.1 DNA-3-methyladenine glycosylase II [Pseudomonas sp. NFPP10]SFI11837.1 DNA-3-methyladenine glycosylase II [Pseudomonas sp. NFPP08]SFN43784.1 DNA-3-methyladenine glycosylase II [Pseudomonas sp. NFPP05]SFX99244.1 DNA-3-methyladenine glycosylase II [Pseudomonas sp. NFPP09]